METAVEYVAPMPARVRDVPDRGHLRVVDRPTTYSALPHGLIRDARARSGHIATHAVLQMHWWQGGECWASHATLAAEVKSSVRQLQRYLKDLVAWGYIAERLRGHGQAKAYSPIQHDTGVAFNTTDVSPLPANTTPVSEQHDTGVAFNTTPVSDRRRRTEEDSSGRKNTPPSGEVAADAAPAPPAPKSVKPKRAPRAPSPVTLAPETMELTERHLAYAAEYGYADPQRVRRITDQFLSHHRFKGTKGRDWYAGWQGWIRNQRDIDDRQAARTPSSGNGRPARPRSDDHLKSSVHLVESETFYVDGSGPDGN